VARIIREFGNSRFYYVYVGFCSSSTPHTIEKGLKILFEKIKGLFFVD